MTFSEMIAGAFAAKGWKAAAAVLLSFFGFWIGPISHFVAAALILVAADTITGISAARKRAERITSRGLAKTVSKSAHYMTAIILAKVVEEVYLKHAPITYLVSSYIGLTEFKSVLENISAITGTDLRAVLPKFTSFIFKKK